MPSNQNRTSERTALDETALDEGLLYRVASENEATKNNNFYKIQTFIKFISMIITNNKITFISTYFFIEQFFYTKIHVAIKMLIRGLFFMRELRERKKNR